MKSQQQIDSVLVDLLFQLIDLLVVGDRIRAKIVVSLEQAFDRAIEAALGQASHHENVVAQRSERFVERSENVLGRCHVSLSSASLLILIFLLLWISARPAVAPYHYPNLPVI